MTRKTWVYAGASALAAVSAVGAGGLVPSAWAGDTTAASTSGNDDAAALDKELLSVEEDVDALKERVFRSKATLQLLKEIVMEGAGTGGHLTVWHNDKLSSAFKIESMQYVVDGQSKYAKADPSGALDETRELKIDDSAITPGTHTLNVDIKVRPTGYGVFSYVKNYQIDVSSNYGFTVEPGRTCTLKALVVEKGGAANSFEDRVTVEYEYQCDRIQNDQKPQ